MRRFIFRQNGWNNTPKHNDTWTHFLKIISWVDNSSSKNCPHLNRDRPNCWTTWHKPSLPLCWGITVTMNGAGVILGGKKQCSEKTASVSSADHRNIYSACDFFPLMHFHISCLPLLHEIYSYFIYLWAISFLLSSLGFFRLYGFLYLSLHL